MSDKIKLSIIFLNFNRLKETQYTSEKLLTIVGQRKDIEIIAVDNGSVDGTTEYLQQQSQITSILTGDNLGIAGYNQGFEIARGEYILVLDDDSCPDNEQTLNTGMAFLDTHHQVGIVACYIKTPDQKQQWSWHLPTALNTMPSPFFVGCGFFIRRSLFKQINWYPGTFFLYQNEIDVAFKTYQAGFDIQYLPDCQIEHRGYPSQRPGWRRVYFPTRNTLWLIRRYYPLIPSIYMIISRLIIGLVRAIQFKQIKTYLNAVYAGFKEPITRQKLAPEIYKKTSVFWKQNSIFHQLFRKN